MSKSVGGNEEEPYDRAVISGVDQESGRHGALRLANYGEHHTDNENE
jgi:hypothetical protein